MLFTNGNTVNTRPWTKWVVYFDTGVMSGVLTAVKTGAYASTIASSVCSLGTTA